MSKKYHFLYKTIRPKTGEFYIGVHSTNDTYDGYQGSGKRINYLKRKNEHLITGIMMFCSTREEAFRLESTIVNADLLKDPLCLNLIVGGKGTRSQQTIDKISKSNTGKQHTEETKQKIRKIRLGSSHTEKTKQLMSSQRKGKIVSSETLSKMRDSMQTAIYKTPDGEFKSYYHASEFYGITPTGMKKRFKSTNAKFKDYIIIPIKGD